MLKRKSVLTLLALLNVLVVNAEDQYPQSKLICTSENPWFKSHLENAVVTLKLKTVLVNVETVFGDESYIQEIHVVTEGSYKYEFKDHQGFYEGAFDCPFEAQIDQSLKSASCRFKNFETFLEEIRIDKTLGFIAKINGKADPLFLNCSVAGDENLEMNK